MKLDEISAELRALASQHQIQRLHELADAIDHRDTPKEYTPGEELAAKIRQYRHKNPDVSEAQISFRFGLTKTAVKKVLAEKPVVSPVAAMPKTAKKLKIKKAP